MMKPETRDTLERLIGTIDAKIALLDGDVGPWPGLADYEVYRAWRTRHEAGLTRICSELEQEAGARFGRAGAHDHSIRIAGTRSTSTSGWLGALRNWQAAARRRIEKEWVA